MPFHYWKRGRTIMSKTFFSYSSQFSHAAEMQFVQQDVEQRSKHCVPSCACSKGNGMNRRSRRTPGVVGLLGVRNMAHKKRELD